MILPGYSRKILKVNVYTLADLLKDIGGFSTALHFICKQLVAVFGQITVLSYLAKDGYRHKSRNFKDYGSCFWIFKFLCCCCDGDRKFKKRFLELVKKDVGSSLDLLT